MRVACGMAFGAEPPSRLGAAGEGAGRAAFWLGPDEWLMIADGADAAADSATCSNRCSREPPTAWSTSRIVRSGSSPAVRRLRASSTPAARSISILAAFPVGFATRTLFDKVEIVLWRRAETTFHLEVWRSFAPFLAASLAEAARGAPEW